MKSIFTQSLKGSWLVMVFIGMSVSLWAKPTWTFRVVVAVERQTADFHQAMLSKPIDQIVREQMSLVNANFNRSPNFNGIYQFAVDSIYVFDGPATAEVFRTHPNFDYGVVIDGFSTNPQGGGWIGSNQVIYHKWPASNSFDSGPFGPGATDGLTHEFGHARGGVDLYGMRVEGAQNPVNQETFEPVSSIMNYPYGNIVWDEYTTNLLNSTAGGAIQGEQWISRPFPPSIGIKALDNQGNPLPNVTLEMFPVDWFSYSVSPTPILKAVTNAAGVYSFISNPYRPSTPGYPWNMRYGNFLIKASYNSAVVYTWMPLYEVQNAYFRNGENAVYNAEIQLPASTATIQITRLNATSFTPGSTIEASFTFSGSFDSGNVFTLFVVDLYNNAYEVDRTEGHENRTLRGVIPAIGSAVNPYTIRIVSSKPRVQSEDHQIRVYPAPADPLTLLAPTYNCLTGAILFTTSGGDGSPITYTAPGITRTALTDNYGVVEPGLRNDPKPIAIEAVQSGHKVTYTFDLKAACSNAIIPKPPVLNQAIPDQLLTVGQPISGSGFAVGLYFSDPSPFIRHYTSDWLFQVDGLPQGLYVFAKDTPSSPNPIRVIFGTPTTAGIYWVTLTVSTAGYRSNPLTTSFRIIVTPKSQEGGPLVLKQPTYDCLTGAILFTASGGDGSPITFTAPGITRTALTDNYGVVEPGLRNDPKPIAIEAVQSGHRVRYVFDFGGYCTAQQPPADNRLVLLAPSYNCSTGAIHFNTAGGDGSPIEFMAAGITPWTTNPDQFVDQESRLAADVQPFTLMARQSGQVITYLWDLKETCARARMGKEENRTPLIVKILGNPLQDQLRVLIQGAESQPVYLLLLDGQGRVMESRQIDRAGKDEKQLFWVNRTAAGVLILQVITNKQRQSIRILK